MTKWMEAFVESPDESPQNAFKSLPIMSNVLMTVNTSVPASAACEWLFSVMSSSNFALASSASA